LIPAFGANGDAGAFHFLEFGANEHRTTTFDGLEYIASYPDLIQAFGANEQADALHYIMDRTSTERQLSIDFHTSRNAPDLMIALGANKDAGATITLTTGIMRIAQPVSMLRASPS
jgi:hypothetical protein